jgi:hypothetical protein
MSNFSAISWWEQVMLNYLAFWAKNTFLFKGHIILLTYFATKSNGVHVLKSASDINFLFIGVSKVTLKKKWFIKLAPFQQYLWWSVLLVEETGVRRENHWPPERHWQTLSHNVASSTPCLIGVRTNNVSGDSHWWILIEINFIY